MFEKLFQAFLELLEAMGRDGESISPSTDFLLGSKSQSHDREVQAALVHGIQQEKAKFGDIEAMQAEVNLLTQQKKDVAEAFRQKNVALAIANAKKDPVENDDALAQLEDELRVIGEKLAELNTALRAKQSRLSSLQSDVQLLDQRIGLIRFQTDCTLNELDGKLLCEEIDAVLNSKTLKTHPKADALRSEFQRLRDEVILRLKRLEGDRFEAAKERLQTGMGKNLKLKPPVAAGKDTEPTCMALGAQRLTLIDLGASEFEFLAVCNQFEPGIQLINPLLKRAELLHKCLLATKWQIDANALETLEVLEVIEPLSFCLPAWTECGNDLTHCIAALKGPPDGHAPVIQRFPKLEIRIKACALEVSRRTQQCLTLHIDKKAKAPQDQATFEKLRGKAPMDSQVVRDAVGSQSMDGFDAELALKQLCADYPSLDAVIDVIGEMFWGKMSDVHRLKRDALLACLARHHGEFVQEFFQIDSKNELVKANAQEFKLYSACADGNFNSPANLGKYTYHLTTLSNLLRKAGVSLDKLAGIAKEGLISRVGGKDGGASQAAADGRKTFGVSMEAASRTNSRLKVASTSNRPEGMKVYDKMFEDKADAAQLQASASPLQTRWDPLDLAALGKLPVQLRFPIRAEYLGCFDGDPIHLTGNLFLLNGVEVPAEDIEALVFDGWVHISAPAFIDAYIELFGMQLAQTGSSSASSSEPRQDQNTNGT
jgi:hypothetical protein